MKLARKGVMLMALVGAGLACGEPVSVARFSNGDRLRGEVVSLSPETLEWKSPLLEGVASFDLRKVLDVSLPSEAVRVEADHEAEVSLTNGDRVRGQLVSVTEKEVVLSTWFAGEMKFNRLMVDGISVEGVSHLIYRGPVSMDDWIQTNPDDGWTYERSAFRSGGKDSIALDGVLPEEVSVSFDCAWKDEVGLKVLLFSDDPETADPDCGGELTFQRGNVSLRNGLSKKFIGSVRLQGLLENDRVRIEIRASARTGSVCVYVDENLRQVWHDPELAGQEVGKALHFVSQPGKPVRISRIEVAPWDGKISEFQLPQIGFNRLGMGGIGDFGLLEEEELEEGRMKLANGDSIKGEVLSIEDSRITLKTEMGEVRVPVSRFRDIALPEVEQERCIRRKGDIRAWFSDDTSIVFRLDRVGDGTLEGSSQNFGEAVFQLSAFKRLEFNIYDWKLDDMRGGEEW